MPEGTEEPLVSQVFRYCCDVYKIMDSEANTIRSDDPSGGSMRVWEGFTTKLIRDRMGLSVPYYTAIRSNLLRMGCVRQLRRGGGSSASQWELIREPTEELWNTAPHKRSYSASKQDAALGQITDVVRRLTRLEQNFDTLIRAMAENGGRVPFDEPPPPPRLLEVIDE